MKKIKENILSWCEYPEEGAVQQAINLSRHPWLVGNVCLMPDTHEGYGMPIGGVVALDKAICPNMVGVDIGCGMAAMKSNLTDISTQQLQDIWAEIMHCVPVGFSHHSTKQENEVFEKYMWNGGETPVCEREFESAHYQIGTLGGGNHFIEIQRGDDGFIWFMIHSGSRNLGKQVADYYNKEAKKLCEMFRQYEIIENDLAVIPMGHPLFNQYRYEMGLCLEFAKANRELMAKRIVECFRKVIREVNFIYELLDIHHNYATIENHYGRNVWVHRKGATLAKEGKLGIIPGSQGSASYIVEGLGNEASLCSCSHGAGRCMSRKKARENLDLEKETQKMKEVGVLFHSLNKQENLDEASSAYKNIDEVMEQQKDLVKPVVKLLPLASIKG